MISLPKAFRRDAARIAKLTELECSAGPQETLHMKRVASEVRQLITRWQNDPACLAEEKSLSSFQVQLRAMENSLEKYYLASLRKLLGKWRQRFIQETIFKGEIITQQMIQIAPTQAMADELKAIVTDGAPQAYNPVKMYRVSEKLADEYAEAYRIEWAEFKASWPERIDAAFLTRLGNLTIEDHHAWLEEISPATP